MTNEELKNKIAEKIPDLQIEENEFLNVEIDSKVQRGFLEFLRNDSELSFDFLFCLSGVDRLEYLLVVYHLESTTLGHKIVVKAKVDRENPQIETVSNIWRTAEFHEREAYDFYGIEFTGHPDLRRIFLEDDWEGWPLRKDYTDNINIVEY